jgi:hypothetical protein
MLSAVADATLAGSHSPSSKTFTSEDIETAFAGYTEGTGAYSAQVAANYVDYQAYLAAIGSWFRTAPAVPTAPPAFTAYSGVVPTVDAQYFKST